MSTTLAQEIIQENKMGTMPVGKLLANMALPMALSMLVQALYNVVDSIYVSQISDSAVTALSLAFPIQNLQIGFAVGVGVGVNSLLSKSLGERNQEAVNKTAGNGLVMMAIVTALFMLFGIFGVRPYYTMQSDVAATVEGGIAYTRICCLFVAGSFLQILCERLLQSTGRTVYSMITQSVGAIANIVLDPVFIFGWFGLPAMGIAGAAVATVIGQWLGAFTGLYFNLRRNPDVQFARKYIRLDREIAGSILTVGVPAMIMNGIGSVMTFGMNQILQGFSETATAVFGIYFKLQSFFFMPVFGLNGATISIVAYNYGARKPERVKKTIRLAVFYAECIMLVGFCIFQFLPDKLLGLFAAGDAMLAIGVPALRIICPHFLLAGAGIVLSSVFQALGNGVFSLTVSICRQLVVLIPAAWLLSRTGEVNMVWWAFIIAEVVSLALSLVFMARINRTVIVPLSEKQDAAV